VSRGDSATALSEAEREQVERLIIRDHRFHESKHKPGRPGGATTCRMTPGHFLLAATSL
jgi:hypothetical protein